MAAIITNAFRKKIADDLLTEILNSTDSNEYYIGIGKSDTWDSSDTAATPLRTLREERLARSNLQSVKQVASDGASFVIPRYNWTSGSFFSGYDDNYSGIPTNSYYVLTENNDVYICLQQGRDTEGQAVRSTVLPDYADGSQHVPTGVRARTEAFKTTDGYVWKYMYSLSPTKASNFLSSGFVPVQFVAESAGDPAISSDLYTLYQAQVKEAAVPGQVLGIVHISGGTGYSSAPTVIIRGNGVNAAATATIYNGSVVKVEMNNESAALGSGYDYASVVFSGGSPTSPATARAIIGPKQGIGYDPRSEMKATSLMLTTKPNGAENGDFITDQDFRQITLFRNLEYKDSSARFDLPTGMALRSLKMSASTGFVKDLLISGDSASAYIDYIDDSNNIFYHQNEKTGFGTFANNEVVTGAGGATGTISAANGAIDSSGRGAPVDAFSGDLIYVENRARILRSTSQTEDIKVVLTF